MSQKTVRVPEALWTAALAKSVEREDNLSEIIRTALERYVRAK
jgi:hypothetical protein